MTAELGLIGVDWGTSSLRAYLMRADGQIAAERSAPRGIMAVTDGDFAGALAGILGDWATGGRQVLMCGMIGSRQGWREAPYIECPASAGRIAAARVPVTLADGGTAYILPGVRCHDESGTPDVMRGEETQVMGALATARGEASRVFCLPGTHSKHVRTEGGAILRFRTYMTGEVFALLKGHSILGRLMQEPTEFDAAAFIAGIERSGAADGLLHQIFGVRSLALMEEMRPSSLADYLSGLLIGQELRAAWPLAPVHIVGAKELARRYFLGFRQLGLEASLLPSDLAARGLWCVAREAGML